MLCCKGVSKGAIKELQQFLKGCPFDGLKCRSKDKWQCAGNLVVGKECWEDFLDNFQETPQCLQILKQIKIYGVKKCGWDPCNNEIDYMIGAEDYERDFSTCYECYSQLVKLQQNTVDKPRECFGCQEEEITSMTKILSPKNTDYLRKKFHLTEYDKKPSCHLCIYEIWAVTCQSFFENTLKFEELVKIMADCQKIFNNSCLTCGCQASVTLEVHPFIEIDIKAPYRLKVFQCQSCVELLSDKNKKWTRQLENFATYLTKRKISYSLAIQPKITFVYYRKEVNSLIQFLENICVSENLMQQEKRKYQEKQSLNNNLFAAKWSEKQAHESPKILSKNPSQKNLQNSKPEKKSLKKPRKDEQPKMNLAKNTINAQSTPNIKKPVTQSKETQKKCQQMERKKIQRKPGGNNQARGGKNIAQKKQRTGNGGVKKQGALNKALSLTNDQREKYQQTFYSLFGKNLPNKPLKKDQHFPNEYGEGLSEDLNSIGQSERSSQESQRAQTEKLGYQTQILSQFRDFSQTVNEGMSEQNDNENDETEREQQEQYELNDEQSSGEKIQQKSEQKVQSQHENENQNDSQKMESVEENIDSQEKKQTYEDLSKQSLQTQPQCFQVNQQQVCQNEQRASQHSMNAIRQRQLQKDIQKIHMNPAFTPNGQTHQPQQYSHSTSSTPAPEQPSSTPSSEIVQPEIKKFAMERHQVKIVYPNINFEEELLSSLKAMNSDSLKVLKQPKQSFGTEKNKLPVNNMAYQCQNKTCKQSQQGFLFLDLYCLNCFNLYLLGKIPDAKDVQNQKNLPMGPNQVKNLKR